MTDSSSKGTPPSSLAAPSRQCKLNSWSRGVDRRFGGLCRLPEALAGLGIDDRRRALRVGHAQEVEQERECLALLTRAHVLRTTADERGRVTLSGSGSRASGAGIWIRPRGAGHFHQVALNHAARKQGLLLLVGTYRDTEVDPDHPLALVLADLRRESGMERLTLGGLDEAAVTQLLEPARGQGFDALGQALAHAVHAETEGNPFFVVEVIRHLAESGLALRRAGRDAADQLVAELGVPEGVREVVARRLARLPRAPREVLGVAALIGREFDVSHLVEASPADSEGVLHALSISPAHALAAGALPAHHADPVDRMLIAQARAEGLMVVTVDGRFSDYDVELLPVA